MPAASITEDLRSHLQEFVRRGGDLIVFEQYAQGNMSVIDNLFGLKTGGAGKGVTFTHPDLVPKLQAAGLDDAALAELHFYNGYANLPANAIVLAKTANDRNGAVVIPYEKGRVILIGLTNEAREIKFAEAVLDLIYAYKSNE